MCLSVNPAERTRDNGRYLIFFEVGKERGVRVASCNFNAFGALSRQHKGTVDL